MELALPKAKNWGRAKTLIYYIKFAEHFPGVAIRIFRENIAPLCAALVPKSLAEEKKQDIIITE